MVFKVTGLDESIKGEYVVVKSKEAWTRLSKLIFFFTFFFLFMAAHAAYGKSQARVELELKLVTYTTATAMPDLSYVCDLYHRSWQSQILNHWARPGIELHPHGY